MMLAGARWCSSIVKAAADQKLDKQMLCLVSAPGSGCRSSSIRCGGLHRGSTMHNNVGMVQAL